MASRPQTSTQPPGPTSTFDRRKIISVVDSLPATRGLDIFFIDDGRVCRIRDSVWVQSAVVIHTRRTPPPAAPAARPRPPQPVPTTSPAMEWLGLGLNCGGAVLAWVGTAAAVGGTPFTGGISAAAAVPLYVGATVASAQCGVSVYRMSNLYTGHVARNNAMDANPYYQGGMLAADGLQLALGVGSVKSAVKAAGAYERGGISIWRARSAQISRPMRRRLTVQLGVTTTKRIPSKELNALARRHLLDMLAASLGLVSSGTSGVIKEVSVWIMDGATN